MIQLHYARYDINYEDFCVKLYNSLSKHKIYNIHIVEHTLFSETQKQFIESFCEPTYIEPHRLVELHQQCTNPIDIFADLNTHIQTSNSSAKTAIVIYMYYTKYTRELCSYINRFREGIDTDLYFYICETSGDEVVDRLYDYLDDTTGIYHEFVPNNGRDIRSFLQYVQSGKYKKYDYICKLHGKKTTYLHSNWRQEYCRQLLDIHNYKTVIMTDKNTDIYPVDQFSIIEKYNTHSANYLSIKYLTGQIKVPLPKNMNIKYNAGTMFWCSNRYCSRLFEHIKNTDITSMFEPEPIPLDGTISHAWERVFWLL